VYLLASPRPPFFTTPLPSLGSNSSLHTPSLFAALSVGSTSLRPLRQRELHFLYVLSSSMMDESFLILLSGDVDRDLDRDLREDPWRVELNTRPPPLPRPPPGRHTMYLPVTLLGYVFSYLSSSPPHAQDAADVWRTRIEECPTLQRREPRPTSVWDLSVLHHSLGALQLER
jgi:hypothetical protein